MTATIEYHYETMGRILSHLISQGLSRVDFENSDAMEIMTERWGSEEEVIKTFFDVLFWMYNEGLIRIGKVQEYDFGYSLSRVQLTSRGIAAIQSKPDDEAFGDTIEKKISDSGKGDLDASIYTKIGSFVGGFAGGFTKSVS
ncbi:hypothetical protein [Roseibium sp.]|uniref:hypothetical protein n=1 Tax=Roseibium sp. TaxID=1936156 RepID=UPI003D0981A8